MSSLAEAEGQAPARTGHPAGLYVLFGAEMWERFSYYGMRALLVLYLTKHLTMTRKDALDIYATYTGLVYLTPLIGGFLADKVLGQRKAILIGGIVMAMGHFAMAFEHLLYLALGLLILGNGFFKPNISTMVGQLYPQGDARRDGAYTIFYMGINLGAFFSPLVCGTLGESENFGWHYGFGAAGVGMVFGLTSFLVFQRHLVGGYPPGREEPRLRVIDWVHVLLFSLGCVAVAYGAIEAWPYLRPFKSYLLYGLGSLVPIGLLYMTYRLAATAGTPEGVDWQRIAVIVIVGIFSIVFWMGFEQAGGTLTLFADARTHRAVPAFMASIKIPPINLGILKVPAIRPFPSPFPASYFQSVNPFLIFLMAPLFSMLWTGLDRTRFKLNSAAKMGIGLLLLGLGFVVMAGADRTATAAADGKAGAGWLASVYFLFTMGELCLSPIGLSLVNKLAPARLASMMMAIWFLSTAFANYLAGKLESIVETYHNHFNLWEFLIVTSVVPGLILLALTPILKKMGHGRI